MSSVLKRATLLGMAAVAASGACAPPEWEPESPVAAGPASVEAALTGPGTFDGYVTSGDVTVSTRAELLSALATATYGTVIWVNPAASINMTGDHFVSIPAGVTLASNRNQSGGTGALLYSTELDTASESWGLFSVAGEGVRVTGLRLRGPDQGTLPAYDYDNSHAFSVTGANFTLDNCELWGWSYAGVKLTNAMEAYLYNNSIHHNQRQGLGYGVVLVDDSSALIQNNTFAYNRHAIAASGIHTQRYEARYNTVSSNGASPSLSHSFDMHGENEALGNGSTAAGDVIHVRRNNFRASNAVGFKVRGRPSTGMYTYNNCFAHSQLYAFQSGSAATSQSNYEGNRFAGGNTLSTTTANCTAPGANDAGFRILSGGTGSWLKLSRYTYDVSEIAVGDFDGDGIDDIFRATGHRWYYSPGGASTWKPLAGSSVQLSGGLRFGDFDGNGKTDVFRATGANFEIAYDGLGAWINAGAKTETTNLKVGDFNGDGKDDIFHGNGTTWRYSSMGSGAWVTLNTSSYPANSLGYADFNGDGKTDVFRTDSTGWYVSYGATTAWTKVSAFTQALSTMRLGDFNGDGKADAMRAGSYAAGPGFTTWTAVTPLPCTMGAVLVGRFNSDAKSDLFSGRCGD